MSLVIQSIIACGLFTLLIVPKLYKNPISMIMSYPPEIRERVESLPDYQENIQQIKHRHISAKIISAILIAIFLALVAYFSGAKDFSSAFSHIFVLFFVVNMYDLLVLDIGLFCHNKRVRIPGTEDMVLAYRNPVFHVKGAIKGIVIGVVIALVSASVVFLISTIG
jgi:hypothetical protein